MRSDKLSRRTRRILVFDVLRDSPQTLLMITCLTRMPVAAVRHAVFELRLLGWDITLNEETKRYRLFVPSRASVDAAPYG